MKNLTFKIIADLVLGLDLDKERDTVKRLEVLFDVWFKGLFSLTFPFPGNPFMAAVRARADIKSILLQVIERRRRCGGRDGGGKRDVMDLLLAPTRDDAGGVIHLTDDEVFDTLVVLLFAGSDTSTCNMTWILKFLCQYPAVRQRLLQEHANLCEKQQTNNGSKTHITWDEMETLRYTNQVIFEVLRVHPPVGGSFRKVTKDLVYKDYLIPKGYTVAFDFQSMTQNPAYHKESTAFNPDRFASSDSAVGGLSAQGFTPFGGGARMCLGYRLAIAEMNVFLHHMILDYEWSLAPDASDETTYFPLPMPFDGVPLNVKQRRSVRGREQ
jgi:cytochrome P450